MCTNLFRDLVGLDANQANALQALLTTTQSAQDFSERAARMAEMAANLQAMKMMDEDGSLSDADRQKLKKDGYKNATQKPYNNKNLNDTKKAKDDGLISDQKAGELASNELGNQQLNTQPILDNVANSENGTFGNGAVYASWNGGGDNNNTIDNTPSRKKRRLFERNLLRAVNILNPIRFGLIYVYPDPTNNILELINFDINFWEAGIL